MKFYREEKSYKGFGQPPVIHRWMSLGDLCLPSSPPVQHRAQHRLLTKAVSKCWPCPAPEPDTPYRDPDWLSPSQFPHLFQASRKVNDTLSEGVKAASSLEIGTALSISSSSSLRFKGDWGKKGLQQSPPLPDTLICHLLESDT